jgi:PAS domain S-box-containing protein
MSMECLKAIIECMGDPVFVKDRQHRLVFVNDAACKMFGKPREQLVGKTDHELFPKEHADVFRKADDALFETGEESVSEEQITDTQGNVRTIVTKKSLYINDAGEKLSSVQASTSPSAGERKKPFSNRRSNTAPWWRTLSQASTFTRTTCSASSINDGARFTGMPARR